MALGAPISLLPPENNSPYIVSLTHAAISPLISFNLLIHLMGSLPGRLAGDVHRLHTGAAIDSFGGGLRETRWAASDWMRRRLGDRDRPAVAPGAAAAAIGRQIGGSICCDVQLRLQPIGGICRASTEVHLCRLG